MVSTMVGGAWVLLMYRLPREPSTPRIALWRTLRRLGAAQLLDGLVALPADARTREQFDWLADQVVEAGGQAGVWEASPGTAAQERALATDMCAAAASEYRALIQDAERARDAPVAARRRTLGRLRRELRAVRRRDFFPPPERELAVRAVEALAATLGRCRGEVGDPAPAARRSHGVRVVDPPLHRSQGAVRVRRRSR